MSTKSPRGTKSASKRSIAETISPARRSRRIRGVQAELDVNALEEIEKRNRRSRSRSTSVTSQTARALLKPIDSQETVFEDRGSTEVAVQSSSQRRSLHVDFDQYDSFTEEDTAMASNNIKSPSVTKSASQINLSTSLHIDSYTQKLLTPNTTKKKKSFTPNTAEEHIDSSETIFLNTENIISTTEQECLSLSNEKLEEQAFAETSLEKKDVTVNEQDINETPVSEGNDDDDEQEVISKEQDEDETSIGWHSDEEIKSSNEEEETDEQSKNSSPVKNDKNNLHETEVNQLHGEMDDDDEGDVDSMDMIESDEDEDPVQRAKRRNHIYEEDVEDEKTVNKRREKYKKSAADDQFFCMEEMNAFLDEQDKLEEKRRLGKFEDADEMVGMIERFEEENLRPRTWVLEGEVTGEAREKDTLLDNFIDADFRSKSAPTITSDVTENLEAIILKRVKDKLFDDVARKQRRDELIANYRAKTTFDETVRKSLIDVYEEEFLAKQSDEKGSEEYKMDPVVTEIRSDMDSLFKTLDALSHYQFVPAQVKPDVKIVKNVASLQTEEVGPMASTEPTSSLLAPEEVIKHVNAAPKSNEEYDSTDRKRLRRKKKVKQKVMAKKGLTPVDENSELPKIKKTILKKKKKAILKEKVVKRRKVSAKISS